MLVFLSTSFGLVHLFNIFVCPALSISGIIMSAVPNTFQNLFLAASPGFFSASPIASKIFG